MIPELTTDQINNFSSLIRRQLWAYRDLLDDVIQDTLLAVLSKLDNIEDRNLEAYVMTVARNKLRTALRSSSRRSKHLWQVECEALEVMAAYQQKMPTLDPPRASDKEVIDDLINRLPKAYREVVRLRYKGLNYRDIAKRIGGTVNSVTLVFFKARKLMQRLAQEQNAEYIAA